MKAIERLYEYFDFKRIKVAQFERKSGIGNGYFGKQRAKNADIGSTILQKVIENCPDLNSEWLIKGVGNMLLIENKPNEESVCCKNTLPLIPIEAIAGFVPGVDFDGVVLKNCESYLVPEFVRIGAEFMIRVSGESMVPTYRNGDILACRKIEQILFFQWGKVYILDTSQGALVKRIRKHDDNFSIIAVRLNFFIEMYFSQIYEIILSPG